MTSSQTPSFTRPPLVETALSLQFNPIERFSNAHLGVFWDRSGLSRHFPVVLDALPIDPQFERFGNERKFLPAGPWVKVGLAEGGVRLQMTTPKGDRMVQLQNGRLVHNWRRMEGAEYPRFASILPEFLGIANLLAHYLQEGHAQTVVWNQWEVVYVNIVKKGTIWDSPSDWPGVLPPLFSNAGNAGPGPWESGSGAWRFVLPDSRGRLHVDVHHGWGEPLADDAQLVVLQLTARGPVTGQSDDSIKAGLNLGHNAVVETFVRVTGERAHRFWGRTT